MSEGRLFGFLVLRKSVWTAFWKASGASASEDWRPLWSLLWRTLETFWQFSETPGRALGTLLRALELVWRRLVRPWGAHGGLWNASEGLGRALGGVLEASWRHLGDLLAACGVLLEPLPELLEAT